jgi:acetyl esterase/lipase
MKKETIVMNKMLKTGLVGRLNPLRMAALLALFVLSAPLCAQDSAESIAITTPEQPNAIEIGTPTLPDAKTQESWHRQYGRRFARNVTIATLTPFLPDPAKASGAAVVVAPGGGFFSLSMENEGWDVARALADKGIAAFVLKYRLNQTAEKLADFEAAMAARFTEPGAQPPRPTQAEMKTRIAPQLEDARAAFALIRSRAKEWKIDTDRIGMVGFSAGAMLTMATALEGVDAKPAFIGNVYGPLMAVDVPENAPPLFIALAADDPFFASSGFGLIESWRAANKPVEFHYYEQGGHGFGMYPKDTTSTGWFDAFVAWMTMHGMLKPKVG